MTIPSGFGAFTQFHDLSETPAEWDADARALFQDWKLERARAHFKWLVRTGYCQLVRQQSGRAASIDMVRDYLDDMLAPPPPVVYRPAYVSPPARRDVARDATNKTYGEALANILIPRGVHPVDNSPAGD